MWFDSWDSRRASWRLYLYNLLCCRKEWRFTNELNAGLVGKVGRDLSNELNWSGNANIHYLDVLPDCVDDVRSGGSVDA